MNQTIFQDVLKPIGQSMESDKGPYYDWQYGTFNASPQFSENLYIKSIGTVGDGNAVHSGPGWVSFAGGSVFAIEITPPRVFTDMRKFILSHLPRLNILRFNAEVTEAAARALDANDFSILSHAMTAWNKVATDYKEHRPARTFSPERMAALFPPDHPAVRALKLSENLHLD